MLLILGTFSKASRPGRSPLVGPDLEGSQAPSCVEGREECLPASGTFCSVNSNQCNYMLHGRVFQDGVYFYLACLRSFSIAGYLCAGDLAVWWNARDPYLFTFLYPWNIICQLCLPTLVRSP